MRLRLSSQHLFILSTVLLGTLVRGWYGWHHRSWGEAPDQLAWEIALDEVRGHGLQGYDQLVHYPHEGGTALISLSGLLTGGIGRFPSLSLIALLLDSLSRGIQLLVVLRYFPKKVFFFFALWTVFALPGVLPWGTVNYGLHSLASFLPFVLIHLLGRERKNPYSFALDGCVLALALWFSYDSIVLLPVYIAGLVRIKDKRYKKRYFFPAFSLVLILHLIVRFNVDAGFHLAPFGTGTLRGESFPASGSLHHLVQVWMGALPGSSVLPSVAGFSATHVRLFWLLLVTAGCIGFIVASRKGRLKPIPIMGFLCILVFILLYALSPFYQDSRDFEHYATYRHWTFILPMLCLFTIVGLYQIRLRQVWVSVFIFLCSWGSVRMIRQEPSGHYMMREAGYTLGTKWGHDPVRISRMADDHPEQAERILQGAGWGITYALLKDPREVSSAADTLMELVRDFPYHQQRRVMEGVVYAFGTQVNPRLDIGTLQELKKRYPEMQGVVMVR